jgi:hypothetical protein
MTERVYVFIDGGYLRKRFSEATKRWLGQEVELDLWLIRQTGFLYWDKCFYANKSDHDRSLKEKDHQTRESQQRQYNKQVALISIMMMKNNLLLQQCLSIIKR